MIVPILILCFLLVGVFISILHERNQFKVGDLIWRPNEQWEEFMVYQIEVIGKESYKLKGLSPASYQTIIEHKCIVSSLYKIYNGPRDNLRF